jgi:uncharacterized coiled-coil protein SlyX
LAQSQKSASSAREHIEQLQSRITALSQKPAVDTSTLQNLEARAHELRERITKHAERARYLDERVRIRERQAARLAAIRRALDAATRMS